MPVSRIWLGGWGVAPETVATVLGVPADTVLPPTAASLRRALAAPGEVALGGWSLGARLLLEAIASGVVAPERPVTLVCPFLAFPLEADEGGRVSVTQVKFLRRWLAKAPLPALADFYRRAALTLPDPDRLPYAAEDLEEGLDRLADLAPVPRPGVLPPSVRLLAGARDPLTDHDRLATLLPRLKLLPGAGHDLADFADEIAAGG